MYTSSKIYYFSQNNNPFNVLVFLITKATHTYCKQYGKHRSLWKRRWTSPYLLHSEDSQYEHLGGYSPPRQVLTLLVCLCRRQHEPLALLFWHDCFSVIHKHQQFNQSWETALEKKNPVWCACKASVLNSYEIFEIGWKLWILYKEKKSTHIHKIFCIWH